MVSINTTQVTGNITGVPELKTIGEGEDNVVVEGVVIHNWRLKEGITSQPEKRAVVPFKVYGKQARRFADSITPKTNVLLTGHLETDEWMQGDQPRSRTFLYVSSFQYNSPKATEAPPAKSPETSKE